MLFLRGAHCWYKAPDGERVSTETTIKSEMIEFKIRKLAELRIGLPHIKTPTKSATVNELLDAHLTPMRRRGRKSTKGVAQILTKHVRPYFGDRIASTLTYRDAKEDKVKLTTINRHPSHLRSDFVTGYKRVTPRFVEFIPAFPIVSSYTFLMTRLRHSPTGALRRSSSEKFSRGCSRCLDWHSRGDAFVFGRPNGIGVETGIVVIA